MAARTPTQNPVICAVDTTDMQRAQALCKELKNEVGAVKLGLEFFTTHGAPGVRKIVEEGGMPVFLDLKFHDIPNTVAGAIRSAMGVGAFMTTVHACGGRDMMRAAVDASMEIAAATGKERPLIVGVTVLTSMDENDLSATGVNAGVQAQVLRLAELAKESGLDGVVCSPHEIEAIRKACGADFKLIVPGIRPAGSHNGDQKRVLTPHEAIRAGADFLVIGRPITGETNPAAAARKILAEV